MGEGKGKDVVGVRVNRIPSMSAYRCWLAKTKEWEGCGEGRVRVWWVRGVRGYG